MRGCIEPVAYGLVLDNERPMPHISVCVCTYKRPELLQQLLNELACQETQGRFTVDVVVVDNDAAESARSVVEHWVSTDSRLAVAYCVEPQQNIALARNAAIKRATGDFIAFFDDDQVPIRQWLLTLLLSMREIRGRRRSRTRQAAL